MRFSFKRCAAYFGSFSSTSLYLFLLHLCISFFLTRYSSASVAVVVFSDAREPQHLPFALQVNCILLSLVFFSFTAPHRLCIYSVLLLYDFFSFRLQRLHCIRPCAAYQSSALRRFARYPCEVHPSIKTKREKLHR